MDRQPLRLQCFSRKTIAVITFVLTLTLVITMIPATWHDGSVYAAESNEPISDNNDSINDAVQVTKFGKNNLNYGTFISDMTQGTIFNAASGSKFVDEDYYSVKLNYRAPIHINIGSEFASKAGINYFGVAIIQPNKTTVTEIKKINSASGSFDYTTKVLPAGTYYIAIYTDDTTKSWNNKYWFYVDRTANINNTRISYFSEVYYTGNNINFIKSVEYTGDGTFLTRGVDYDVKYSAGNIEVGKGKITVVGKGGFTGTRVMNNQYKILPKKSKISGKKTVINATLKSRRKLTINWKKIKGANYYQVKYRIKGAKKWSSKTVKGTKTSITLNKLRKGKKYQYKVRGMQKLSGYATCYSKYSKTKTSKKIK